MQIKNHTFLVAGGGSGLGAATAHMLIAQGGVLGGGFAGYNIYRTADGWIALAALEPHFLARVLQGLGLDRADGAAFSAAFKGQTSVHWQAWAKERDIPLTAVR